MLRMKRPERCELVKKRALGAVRRCVPGVPVLAPADVQDARFEIPLVPMSTSSDAVKPWRRACRIIFRPVGWHGLEPSPGLGMGVGPCGQEPPFGVSRRHGLPEHRGTPVLRPQVSGVLRAACSDRSCLDFSKTGGAGTKTSYYGFAPKRLEPSMSRTVGGSFTHRVAFRSSRGERIFRVSLGRP